jgi:putative ABC transport system permease protein
MAWLPLANIAHHRLRSALSALGIAISVCLVLTLTGLSRGSLAEVLRRWDSVRADLIVSPASTNMTLASGPQIPLAAVDRLAAPQADGRLLAKRITPVYLARMKIAGRENNIYGLRAGDFDVIQGNAKLLAGRLPDADGRAAQWLAKKYAQAADGNAVLEISEQELDAAGGLEMAIDTRLAAQLGKSVGQTFDSANRTWRIVGVYETGAVGRAIAPMATLQHLMGLGLDHVTLVLVQLPQGAAIGPAAQAIRRLTHQSVVPKNEYQALLLENVGIMFVYIYAVNAVALTIAFLFIMITLYTMVLQRTREIAILKSLGASASFLLRQILAESLLLTAAGAAVGVLLAFGAGDIIEHLRLDLTVSITPHWILAALAAAGAGGVLAAIYPAWRAIRVDVAEALAFE